MPIETIIGGSIALIGMFCTVSLLVVQGICISRCIQDDIARDLKRKS